MIEEFKGKIINDDDISLPTMEDMYYNSLTPILDIASVTEKSVFYIENPPDGEDHVGISEDGTIFTINTGPGKDTGDKKAAFDTPTIGIYTGLNTYTNLSVTTSKCDVGSNAQNLEILAQLTDSKAFEAYIKNKYNKDAYNLGDMKVRLVCVDGPKLPKYTTEWLEKKYIEKTTYKEAKEKGIHIQPFQSEFDKNNGTLSIDIEPAIREYTDKDEIYVYNNIVQVWPYNASTMIPLDDIDFEPGNYGKYEGIYKREITEEDYKRLGIKKLSLEDYDCSKTRIELTDLDSLGRAKGPVWGCLGKETLPDPNASRDPLQSVVPSGWHVYAFDSIPYIAVEGKEDDLEAEKNQKQYLYNRCHLLRYGLTGLNIESRNLITGTVQLNKVTMLEYEDKALNYVKANPDKHILYRVTPDFRGDNLVCHGILMECLSVEDNGASLSFSVYCLNVQKDIVINYTTGEAWDYMDMNNPVNNGFVKCYVLNNNEAQLETINLGLRTRNFIIKTLMSAEDSRLCVSLTGNNKKTDFEAPYNSGYLEPDNLIEKAIQQALTNLKDTFYQDKEWYKHSGYNMYGLDRYGRVLGVVYVKINVDGKLQWVNLNKYIISYIYNSETVKLSNFIPSGVDFSKYYGNELVDRFKPWTYDIENVNYQDNFWTQLETKYGQDKRRRELQIEAFKKAGIHSCISEECLKDWTVSIGDVSFFCPPTSIRTVTQTMTERSPLLRAKGSMAKNIEKSDTELELDLFFNNEYGINGQELQVNLWENKDKKDPSKKIASDEKITYYMNGLRALISEFKFTPFLPIVNTYINETLEIAAVSLEQIDIQTIKGFPRLLRATLRLKNFDYRMYMPQVPPLTVIDDENGGKEVENPFTQCINYDVMRYYYQKPLILGNLLATKLNNPAESLYSFNSLEFMRDTLMSNRTALLPCQFMDPNIDIYIANEDHLKKLLDIKKEAIKVKQGLEKGEENKSPDSFVPNSIEENYIRDISEIWISSNIGKIYNHYSNVRDIIIKAYKDILPPANKEFSVKIKDYSGKEYTIELTRSEVDKEIIKEKVNEYVSLKMHEDIKSKLMEEKLESISGELLVNNITYFKGTTRIFLNIPYLTSKRDISALVDQWEQESELSLEYKADLLQNRIITLNLSDMAYDITSSDPDEPIVYRNNNMGKFLTWCSNVSNRYVDPNKERQELKDAMDWEDVKTLKFDLVGEDIRVDGFQAALKNNFSRVSLIESDGHASQYLGGSDIHLSWTITTKNKDFAALMKKLPEYEAYCLRTYHLVLPCFPIRIDSEFTRMMGVFEVSIENVTVNTVPNQPGVYSISVLAISTDRTLRNREALKQIDNKTDNKEDGISGELNDEGLVNASDVTRREVRTWKDLDDKLSQAEVYPDLELPTIGELGEKGFTFIRYKEKARDKNDLFVDPDFYFYYPYSTIAEVIRSVIQANFPQDKTENKGEDYQENSGTTSKNIDTAANVHIKYSDNSGNSGVTFSSKDNKVTMDDANDVYKDEVERVRSERNKMAESLAQMNDIELIKNMPSAFVADSGKWDISTKIMACFSESFFASLQNLNDADIEKAKDEKEKKRLENLKKFKEFYEEKFKKTDSSGKEYNVLDNNLANLYNALKTNRIDTWVDKDYVDNGYSDQHQMFLIWKHYLSRLYMDFNHMNKETYGYMLESIWAMYTGRNEYNSEINETWWKGNPDHYGVLLSQENTYEKAKKETPINNMKFFGAFEIKTYTYSELLKFLDEDERNEFVEFYNKLDKTSEEKEKMLFVLDPYYRYNPDKLEEYLTRCKLDIDYCTRAYERNILWWIYKLYKAKVFPSFSFDVMRNESKIGGKAYYKAKELIEKEYGQSVYIDQGINKDIGNFIERNSSSIDMGKIFCAIVMSIYNVPLKENPFFQLMIKRDYASLNAKIIEIVSSRYKLRNKVDDKECMLRKFLLALCGYKVINAPQHIGRTSEVMPASRFITNHNTKIALEAAANPVTYLFHSYYDMLRTDYRGRMLKAFPTFYAIFMDEGKEIGLWKLHDNFYSINALLDISIVKSRKIASDTCTLILSNNYSTFTTDDGDGYINYRGASFSDLWDSVFNEKKSALEAERRRSAATKINRAKLQPGIRIHIREGYGSDARELGGIFNGVITNVQPNASAIQIVAQGNGIELMNPIMEDRDADEIQYLDIPGDAVNNIEGGGASPRKIITSFLTTKNGALRRYLRGQYSPNQSNYKNGVKDIDEDSLFGLWEEYTAEAWNKNAYGIEHFGDPDYKDVFPDGEICQNIYEVTSLPSMDQDDAELYNPENSKEEPPYISFEPRGKTMWDVLHICKSVAPDYMVGLASFGFRDTIFFGKPHHYYAYKYVKHDNTYVEKRKPFSQYHILLGDADIMVNNITASSDKVRTVATGLYKDKAGWVDRNKDVGPLWIDKSIYPESQKSMVVDTRLRMKDCNYLLFRATQNDEIAKEGNFALHTIETLLKTGVQSIANAAIGSITTVGSMISEDLIGTWFSDKGKYSSHKKIAWTATANSLKDSVKEMYQGELVILGNPSIKPQDRIFISDRYNDMSGSVLVRDVVHNLNFQTGFTTTIHVDAVSTVDDRDELKIQGMLNYICGQITISSLLSYCLHLKVKEGLDLVIDASKTGGSALKNLIGSSIDTVKANEKVIKYAGQLKDFSKDRMLIKGALSVAKGIGNIGTAAAAIMASPVGFLAVSGVVIAKTFILETIVTSIIGGINNWLLYLVKNERVLQIFPLKKNGRVYTAGLEGNLGLVYGSPTYGECGPMAKVYANLFADSKENDTFDVVFNFIRSCIISPDLRAEAAKFQPDLSYASYIGDDDTNTERVIESTAIGIEKTPAFTFKKKNSFDLSLDNTRAIIRKKNNKEFKAIESGFSSYHVDNIGQILENSNKKNQMQISKYQPLLPYIKNKFLVILHEEPELLEKNHKLNVEKLETSIAGGRDTIVCIKRSSSETDVPFLAKDALIVLNDIVTESFKTILKDKADNIKDEAELSRALNGSKIVLMSGLIIGSENLYCSSGFSFSLKGTGDLANGVLNNIIEKFYKKIEERLLKIEKNKGNVNVAFNISAKSNTSEIRINVAPTTIFADKLKKKNE